MNKYRAKKTIAYGITFDSMKEANRYRELKLLEAAGEIHDIKLQVKFVLIPAQRAPDKVGRRGGVIRGELIERECAYFADFVYFTKSGEMIVEDAKGVRTPDYKIKKKLMLYMCGLRIKEV